jgi:hypothetical protein
LPWRMGTLSAAGGTPRRGPGHGGEWGWCATGGQRDAARSSPVTTHRHG